MPFRITCNDCKEDGKIVFEDGLVFIVCENCGKEREIADGDQQNL